VARLQRVFIDTSELFPFMVMDVLLTLSEDFLFTWTWTDELLDDWEGVIVREGPHAAAAIHGDVDVLLTRNLKHLRTKRVVAAGVEVVTSDDFLCNLLTSRRDGVVESFIRAANRKRRPPVTPRELAGKIAAAGAPRFAEGIQRHLTH